jgi:hypothetical protein
LGFGSIQLQSGTIAPAGGTVWFTSVSRLRERS